MKNKLVIIGHANPNLSIDGANPPRMERPGVHSIKTNSGQLFGRTRWGRIVVVVNLVDIACAYIEAEK